MSELRLLEILRERFRLEGFREGQEEIVRSVYDGRDTLVLMPTGGGKSLCYQLPAMALGGVTLVITPLIALMKDQVDALVQLGIPAAGIHSGQAYAEHDEIYCRLRNDELRLLYVAPERLKNRTFRSALAGVKVSRVAVDEAHCISEWGHDFRPDYVRIPATLNFLGRPPVVALTATATPEVRRDIIKHLDLKDPRMFMRGFDRPNLYYSVENHRYDTEKDRFLLDWSQTVKGPGIIYAATRKKVELVHKLLSGRKITCAKYHAGLEDTERVEAQELFMNGAVEVIAATNAFGMGVDKRDIRYVIHYNFPRTLEALTQEAGRAGRDGLPARAVMMYTPKDRFIQEFFIDNMNPSENCVRRVWETLLRLGRGRLEVTYVDLMRLVGDKGINDAMVSASVKFLEEQGFLRRLDRDEKEATIFLAANRNRLLEAISPRAEARSTLVLWLYRNTQRMIRGTLDDIADDVGITRAVLQKELKHLADGHYIQYEPPFRGRGLFLPEDAPGWSQFDYSRIREKKDRETEKLDTVMRYAHTRGCRRRFILGYFEDPNPVRCACCDRCLPEKRITPESPEKKEIVHRLAEAAAAPDGDAEGIIVRLVEQTRQRYGRGMIVDTLLGSKKKDLIKRGLDQAPGYGSLAHLKRDGVEKVIAGLLKRKLLRVSGPRRYPVLKLNQ